VQAGLTAAWTTYVRLHLQSSHHANRILTINQIPLLQTSSPAQLVARLLRTHLSNPLHSYVFIDFCAGGGGPTPSIERHLNSSLPPSSSSRTSATTTSSSAKSRANNRDSNDDEQVNGLPEPLHFVLTDLHPHTDLWSRAAAQSPNISFVPTPVDASRAPRDLVRDYTRRGKKVFRLFNLAFHHFDDALARRILKDTVDGGGDGFGIFELQDRGLAGFLSCCLFGLGVMVMAPWYAYLWGAPMALFFTYVVPIVPVVLVFDGWMSCLRTRTPEEVEGLLKTCGAEGGEEEIAKWEVKSGREVFMWPIGRVNWVICEKRRD